MTTGFIFIGLIALLSAAILGFTTNGIRWTYAAAKTKGELIEVTEQLKQMADARDSEVQNSASLQRDLNALALEHAILKADIRTKDEQLAAKHADLLAVHGSLKEVSNDMSELYTALFGWINRFSPLDYGVRAPPPGYRHDPAELAQKREEAIRQVVESMRSRAAAERSAEVSSAGGLVLHSAVAFKMHAEAWRPKEFALDAEQARGSAYVDLGLAASIFKRNKSKDPDHRLAELRDEAMLRVLKHLGQRIPLDRERDPGSWSTESLDRADTLVRFLKQAPGFDTQTCRELLMDLVTHRNAEYMAALDELPPDIAQYFLRLTVAEPQPETSLLKAKV